MPTPPPASLSSNGTDWIGPICTERLKNNRGLSSSWICNISEWRSSIKSDQPPQLAVKLLKFTSNFKGVELKGWKPHWCAFVVTCQCYLCYLRVPRVGGHCQLLDALICASETVLAAIRVTWLPSGGPGGGVGGADLAAHPVSRATMANRKLPTRLRSLLLLPPALIYLLFFFLGCTDTSIGTVKMCVDTTTLIPAANTQHICGQLKKKKRKFK